MKKAEKLIEELKAQYGPDPKKWPIPVTIAQKGEELTEEYDEILSREEVFQRARDLMKGHGLTQQKLADLLSEGEITKVSQASISKMLKGDKSMILLAMRVVEFLAPVNNPEFEETSYYNLVSNISPKHSSNKDA